MKKYIISIFFFFSFFISFVSAQEFDITSNNLILYNLNDNTLLYEENGAEKVSVASLTKMMTSIVAIENIGDLQEKVTITAQDFWGLDGYSKAGFNIGDVVTYEDLLYGILLPSGADAVNAIVNNLVNTPEEFIALMQTKAKELGMNNTEFSNPIGKDDEHNYSTAEDMAILLKYALNNEIFYKIFTTRKYTVESTGLELVSTLDNYSKLLDTTIILGAKSGFTKNAGRCLASIAKINDVEYLLIVINSNPIASYNAVKDSLTIYNYYKDNYSYQNILNKGEVIDDIPIKWGKIENYKIMSDEDISMYLKNDANITYDYEGIEEINSKIKTNSKIGEVHVYNGEDLIYTMDVLLNTDIKYYHPYLYASIALGIMIIILIIGIVRNKKNRS